MSKTKTPHRFLPLALCLVMALTLLPVTARAATAIAVDLASPNGGGGYTYNSITGKYTVTVTEQNTTVAISGDGTDKCVEIVLDNGSLALVTIAAGTKISALATSSGQDALNVPPGTTISGEGANITLTGGKATASNAFGGSGIRANGGITLTGAFGAITGGEATVGYGGGGIYANGSVTLKGAFGAITGGNGGQTDSAGIWASDGSVTIESGAITGVITGGNGGQTDSAGIRASYGSVTIDGSTGNITGGTGNKGGDGIGADSGNITINGSTGAITGGGAADGKGGDGIWMNNGNITINGSTGAINGGSATDGNDGSGIYAKGSVTIGGFVDGTITGGSAGTGPAGKAIDAESYAVLDYTPSGTLLNIGDCTPYDANTVTFDYNRTPTGGRYPAAAYVTDGGTVPEPTAQGLASGIGPGNWYSDEAHTTLWGDPQDFEQGIIYVKLPAPPVPPAPPVGPSSGGGSDTPTFTNRTLTDAATGVKVTAGMDTGTRLAVTPKAMHPAGTCAACDEIRARQAAGEVLALHDISLTGRHTGEYEVFIPFIGGDGGYTVLHCNNGVLETQNAPYGNGGVTTIWATLSPFAVVKGAEVTVPEDLVVNPPKTGGAGSALGLVMLVAGLAGAVGLRAARGKIARRV